MEFEFIRQLGAPTTAVTLPFKDTVEADTFEEACQVFAKRHGLKVLEVGRDSVWFETEDKADVRYELR